MESVLSRTIPDGNIGESWEVSDYGSDLSIITNDEFAGRSFREVYKQNKEKILGNVFKDNEDFPLLVKIIDAKDKLSVQVHPDDEYANTKDPESSGKKEAWYILETDQNAEIVCGFSESLNREKYESLIQSNRAESCLQTFHSKSGDAFMINPGTVHAIGAGNLLLEVQQSSDSTYRVYDYGRLGDDGKPRKLHLQKALDVLNFQKSNGQEKISPILLDWKYGKRKLLAANDKFRFEILEFSQTSKLPRFCKENVFLIIHILSGLCSIEREEFKQGDTFLITAEAFEKEITISSLSSETKIAIMSVGSDWVTYL